MRCILKRLRIVGKAVLFHRIHWGHFTILAVAVMWSYGLNYFLACSKVSKIDMPQVNY